MKLLVTFMLLALVAFTSVEARARKNACATVCGQFITSFTTPSNCTDVEDYACICPDEVIVDSYAMCVDICQAREQTNTWTALAKHCKKVGAPINGTWNDHLEEGLAHYIPAANVTKKEIVTIPVYPGVHTVANMATRFEKNHNLWWSEVYGNLINVYFLILFLISFGRLLTLRMYPNKSSPPSKFVSWFRKRFTLPAAFGGKHIEAYKIGRFGIASALLRWQFVALFFLFALNMILLFVDMRTTPGPETMYYTKKNQAARNVGDRASVFTMCLLPILFIMGGRNNVLMFYTGWSFDTFTIFHKWLGRIVLMNCCIHGWTYTYVDSRVGLYNGKGQAAYLHSQIFDDFEDYAGIIAVTMLGLIFIGSVYVIRHRFYEAFLAFHVSLSAVFVGVAYHHVLSHGWMEYWYTVIAIWGFDIFVRLCRIISANPFNKAEITVHGEAVYLTVKPAHGWKAKPGQYAFIYVFRHNFWESHPFSIVETRDGHYVFVAKSHTGMTKKIHKSVTKADGTDTVRVMIEGPYGDSFPVTRYETVLLIAGGIGITAIMSYALEMKRKGTDQHVILYWMVRNQISLRWVKEQLAEITESGLIEVHIFITGEDSAVEEKGVNDDSPGGSSTDLSEKTPIESGKYEILYNQRPSMSTVIVQTIKAASGSVAVVSCGPASLADACRIAVTDNVDQGKGRVDYFEDAFSWA
ncbi:ferric reductase NAD binding domain-containing protein [Lipomyces arxii]|uniref:ferric reductase NAD binding domain-containing protein n=1 Tax=Lipomyces arxii TaxID=56418 RepID=UPI0034D01402